MDRAPAIEHDVEPGPLRRCQVSGSEALNLVIDLGHQPLCDGLLTTDQVQQPVTTYPLSLYHCPYSGLAQLGYVVDGADVYPPDYPYRSGISVPLAAYQRAFADSVCAKYRGGMANPLVVDVGSNDGTLLTGFKRHGCRALGIEPTDVATIAEEENGIVTWQMFFDQDAARQIVADYGKAQIVTMTNVFAHMSGLGEVMRALCLLLRDDGVFITESHYLLDVLEKNQFDTIYHEHVRTYSLMSLRGLFDQYGLEVFDVERGDRYGGNIRAYVGWKGRRPVQASVFEMVSLEHTTGLHVPDTWLSWRKRVQDNRDKTMEFLYAATRAGYSIGGNSCPGRAATLINYYGITRDLVPWLAELPNSLKLGKYMPGACIPIVDNSIVLRERPDYLVLFSWHYADFIIERLRREGYRGKVVLPLPELRVVDLTKG